MIRTFASSLLLVPEGGPFKPPKTLYLLFKRAHQEGLLGKLPSVFDSLRVALYVDDATVFVCPTEQDFITTNCILKIFADASGPNINMTKTRYFPIQCDEINLNFLQAAGKPVSTFPCIYLGLPLSHKKPTRAMLEPMVQKLGDRLPGWKKNFLAYTGRQVLVQLVLSSMPIHFLTVFKMPQWTIRGIDRVRRNFFWKGRDPQLCSGGHCLVNWKTCTRPKKCGGLGFKDLDKFGRALCLKWLWHGWDA
jgi:hypothetical protein